MVDWTEGLRLEARAVVAERRRKLGLPPWNWKDPIRPVAIEDVLKETVDMAKTFTKQCKCCNLEFTTHAPATRYAPGHPLPGYAAEPKTKRVTGDQVVAKPTSAGTEADARGHYMTARSAMDRELMLLERQIEQCDEEMERMRKGINKLEEEKAEKCDRHELLKATLESIEYLVGIKKAVKPSEHALDAAPYLGFKACEFASGGVALDFKPVMVGESSATPMRIDGLKDAAEFDRMFMPESQPCGGLPIVEGGTEWPEMVYEHAGREAQQEQRSVKFTASGTGRRFVACADGTYHEHVG